MPAPNLIGGDLPWGQAAGGANLFQGMGGTPQEAAAALGPNYANAYQSALAMNQQNYQNILSGYQRTTASQADAADAAAGGYTGLTNSVLDRIKGIGAAAQNQIGENYARSSGLASQGLINRGLGNTTVANSVQAGIDRDRSRALVDLQDVQANRLAGYESQLGQAGLASRQHYADQALNLNQNQLGWMNSVNAGYPNAGMYGTLAEQFGRMGQANADRQQAMQIQQRGAGVNPQMAGSPPTTVGGGRGFFDNPLHDLGAGTYTPPSFGGGGRPQFGPPPGTNLIARPDAFSNFGGQAGVLAGGGNPAAGYDSGQGQYGTGGGFGSQDYGGYNLAGEDQPYGQAPNASAGPYRPYGAGGFGSTYPTQAQPYDAAAEYDFWQGF